MCCELTIVCVVHYDIFRKRNKMWDACLIGDRKQFITTHGIHNCIFFIHHCFSYEFRIKIWGNLNHTGCIQISILKYQHFLSFRFNLFLTCRRTYLYSSLFSYFKYDELSQMKCYLFGSSQHCE